LTEIKTCYVLDLMSDSYEWSEAASLNEGRFSVFILKIFFSKNWRF
jgi:hypothetical protein